MNGIWPKGVAELAAFNRNRPGLADDFGAGGLGQAVDGERPQSGAVPHPDGEQVGGLALALHHQVYGSLWGGRRHRSGLRQRGAVQDGGEEFTHDLLDTELALDILINNAAQTIQRPAAFYQHLLAAVQALPVAQAGG